MKKILKYLLVLLVSLLLAYLVVSYFLLELDVTVWPQDMRGFMIIVTGLLFLVICLLVFAFN